ncbi:putative major facilitator superfamily domain, MFS transporter superfamily [Helianthus annuus]|uniref:Major facilitator superfamily domain, MFS transporter superfamily n=1 Tax=Helianthus annuus TaxID=4232 RepID=A0A251RU15_HELAN|nr:protein NUCLEAR FUSION DEFECTIVE 4 [Helianthus annuus]KAF5755233.1 putative major facilitator superfamily domain, MFS transporter superfamily [Helianthus annuus]KAJ0428986.1 putative MFS transporter superfamily [Helianthus annuus]KAJ0433233.1 putative MFS transporter superfamily [Helianthus annuus]KAJ0636116.1 putative MFS transporter superfamily [Helianthus annuus]KAJ0812968.1 putative major facilitator superfamily domain, MFS transporter superfamily [Helianthus annuus]
MGRIKDIFVTFFNNRWLVFVAAMWVQSCAGIGYLFGSISPVIKSSLNYNQKQVARLGVAKDLGDSVGFLAGSMSEFLPMWALLLIGAVQNFVGYGWVWLVVTGKAPMLPLWVMCLLIFIGTNGETYFNTVALVSCVQNFPKSRGPIVGILKGFAGLSGAILTQIYALINSPDKASLIFMVAVGPTMVGISLMFIVRPVGGHRQLRISDRSSFSLIYCVCLVLAAYLMGVMLVEDLIDLNQTIVQILTSILFVLLVLPIGIPLWLTFSSDPRPSEEEPLISESQNKDQPESSHDPNEIIFSEVEDEKPADVDSLPANERQKRILQLQSRLAQAAAEGAVRIKRRKGPHRGEDFDLTQALIKADFWLLFWTLLLGSGSGLTVIDNLGQMSESLGYDNTHIFVSMISIWNFLGRVGGGYVSEIVVRDYAYPRPVALAVAQGLMSIGHLFFAMGWPGAMYIGTLLIGLGYGAHWAIIPATASELFGVKKFGALYNFLTLANPGGSLVFSGLIASYIYDSEAEKQAKERGEIIIKSTSSMLTKLFETDDALKCTGSICFFLTYMLMSGLCIIALILSLILVRRTKTVYQNLYGKTRT